MRRSVGAAHIKNLESGERKGRTRRRLVKVHDGVIADG